MTATLRVEAAGPLTTIQDGGRTGYLRFGVPASGAIDRLAFTAANVALGNPTDAALVEVSAGGITLVGAGEPVDFALCGGDFTADIDGRSLGGWLVHTLEPGQRLRVRSGGGSNWACLAFSGQLIAGGWLGSRSTHALSNLGGGAVREGEALVIERPRVGAKAGRLPRPSPPPIEIVRIIPGPQEQFFDGDALAALTGQPFSAGAAFDRMGRSINGPALPPLSLGMPSQPVVRGALQVDGAGLTTLLLADHQTTGGYPKIATVIDADIDHVAQLVPGSAIQFEHVSQVRAIAIAKEAYTATQDYLRAITNRLGFEERLRSLNLIDGMWSS